MSPNYMTTMHDTAMSCDQKEKKKKKNWKKKAAGKSCPLTTIIKTLKANLKKKLVTKKNRAAGMSLYDTAMSSATILADEAPTIAPSPPPPPPPPPPLPQDAGHVGAARIPPLVVI